MQHMHERMVEERYSSSFTGMVTTQLRSMTAVTTQLFSVAGGDHTGLAGVQQYHPHPLGRPLIALHHLLAAAAAT
jgi:hypothetical protein